MSSLCFPRRKLYIQLAFVGVPTLTALCGVVTIPTGSSLRTGLFSSASLAGGFSAAAVAGLESAVVTVNWSATVGLSVAVSLDSARMTSSGWTARKLSVDEKLKNYVKLFIITICMQFTHYYPIISF
jgi:hypothetical protein